MQHNIPVVGSLAYKDTVAAVPDTFTARLVPEPDNRYNLHALCVRNEAGATIGYVAPDVARHYYDAVLARHEKGGVVNVPGRRSQPGARVDVLMLLDLSSVERVSDA